MVREIETEESGGLADVVTLHQQIFRLIDNIIMYIADSCAACGFADNVAKVAGGICQL